MGHKMMFAKLKNILPKNLSELQKILQIRLEMPDRQDTLLSSKEFLAWPLLLLDFNRGDCIIGPN